MSLLLGPIYPTDAPAAGGVAIADVEVDGYMLARFTIANDGLQYGASGNLTYEADYLIGPWISPQVGMNLYECRATALDVDRPQGTFDEWLDLAYSWGWAFDVRTGRDGGWGDFEGANVAAYQGKSGSFLLEIRRKSDLVVVDSCTVTIVAMGNA